MNTKNTKTIIIILLIIANIFFIYNRIDLREKTENISSEMVDDAVNILRKSGFVADSDKIPVKKPSNPIYEGIYSDYMFDNIVKYFSGVSDDDLKELGYMVVPPSDRSYVAGEYRFIFSQIDYFKISIIEKSYIDPDNIVSLEEETQIKTKMLLENVKTGIQKNDIKKAENIIRDFLRKYKTQDIKLGFEVVGFSYDNNKNTERVLINQTVDGLPVGSHTVYIEIQNDEVKYFSGKWYFGEFVEMYKMPLLDSVNILFKCLQIDGSTVQENGDLKEMYPEYSVIQHDTKMFFLTPSWRIEFESGVSLSYNMITGVKKIN